MTESPLDTYIKSPPPADERSHFNYLEEQLTKLENVSKKHVVRIGDNNESAKALVLQEANARVSGDEAQATYTQTVAAQTLASATALVNTETTARTTADTALASQITSLNASVGTVSASITSEASVRATADTALGTRIDNLVLTNGSSAAVIIDEEASARIAADYALGVRIDSLTATVGTNTSAISTEQTARSTRDDALAKQLFTMSSGSSRIYIATSAPSSTGRQAGDVWFDSSNANNYKPYVWARSTPSATTGSYDWRDNSDGSFTNLVGNYAVYTQAITTLTNATTSQASSITALQTTVGDSTAGLVKDVSALTTTVGGSSSGLVKDVTTLQSTTAQQRIFRQSTQPSTATADRKVGDLWYDTGNGNTPYFWNGTAWVLNTDTTRASTASLITEQQARTTADTALASYLMSASAGTSRVYTADPGTTGRQNGDVWIKPEENFKQYVWYNSAWRDNTDGSYSQYIGILANVTTTAGAAYTTATNASGAAANAQTIAQQASQNVTTISNAVGQSSDTTTTNTVFGKVNNANSVASNATDIANLAQSIANGVSNNVGSPSDPTSANTVFGKVNNANAVAVSAAYQASQVSASVGSPSDPTSANTVYGKINNVTAALATNTDALATSIQTVSASVGAPTDASTANTVYGNINSAKSAASDAKSTANTASANASSAIGAIGSVNDSSSANTVYGKINSNTASISTVSTATASINGALSTQWAIVGSLGGPSNNIVTLSGTRKADGSTGTYGLEINANVLINGTLTADKIVDKSVSTGKIEDNAISRSGFVTGVINSTTPSQSTQVTVRSGARIQFIAILEGTNSVTVTSTPWANYTNPFYGTTAVAESAQPDFGTIGYLNAVRSISGTSDVVKSYKILGYKSSSSERYIYGPDGSGRWQKVRDWVYSPIAVTGILYYPNTTSSEQTVTFTITTTSGSNSGSVVASTVTGSATELAK
jgi:hypothetical protein